MSGAGGKNRCGEERGGVEEGTPEGSEVSGFRVLRTRLRSRERGYEHGSGYDQEGLVGGT